MVKRAVLEGGKVLKGLIKQFLAERTEQNAFAVLHCLRDSFVFIPCTVKMSEEDKAKFIQGKVGDEVTTENDIRFIPDTLQNGEAEFFSVFSSAEEMGEYGNNFSKIEKHFFEAMSLVMGNENLVGIVVNAFSTPFIVEKGLFELIGSLPTNVED